MPKYVLGDNDRTTIDALKQVQERLNGKNGDEWKDALGRFMRKENPWAEPRQLLKLLYQTAMLYGIPSGSGQKFIVADHFKVDLSPEAPVMIRSLNTCFKQNASGEVETGIRHIRGYNHELLYAVRGTPLYKHLEKNLSGRLRLTHVWRLLEQQGRAQSGGPLRVNQNCGLHFASNIIPLVVGESSHWLLELWNPPGMSCWDIHLLPPSYSERFRAGSHVITSS